jgi:hypothetical protein
VSDGRQVGLVHRLVGLGFAKDTDFLVVLENGVPGVDDAADGGSCAFGLADVGALACEPEYVILAADLAGDVDAAACAFERVPAIGRIVGREGSVDRAGVFPEPRRDNFGKEPFAIEDFPDRGDSLLSVRPVKTASKPSFL